MTVSTVAVGGINVTVVNHDPPRCTANGCDALLRLRRSVTEGLCCCHRGACANGYEGTEPECACGQLLMVDDPPGELCKECAA